MCRILSRVAKTKMKEKRNRNLDSAAASTIEGGERRWGGFTVDILGTYCMVLEPLGNGGVGVCC